MAGDTIKNIANNRKAFHEYFVEESFECGIELAGTEVKSLRQGGASLKEAWCEIVDGEVFVKQMHIAPYDKGNIFNKDPLRPRKLLLHKSEIRKLIGQTKQQGFTLIPLSLYLRVPGSSCRWACAAAKSSTTSVRTSPSGMPSAIFKEH